MHQKECYRKVAAFVSSTIAATRIVEASGEARSVEAADEAEVATVAVINPPVITSAYGWLLLREYACIGVF
jgi:hypothetical protein